MKYLPVFDRDRGTSSSTPARRRAALRVMLPLVVPRLTLLPALFLACSHAGASGYIGIGAAAHEGASGGQERGAGVELRAGWKVRETLSIEAGLLQRSGDLESHLPNVAADDRYRWRAFYAGPRVTLPLAGGWHATGLLALAHVDARDRQTVLNTGTTPPTPFEQRVDRATLGAVAALGIARDIGERHQLWLELRRVHAGLGRRCSFSEPFADCTLPAYESSDGISVGWSLRFD